MKDDGSYEDLAALPETLKRAARCGVIHCELLPEHVRHARGRGCFLIDYDPRLVHVVGASDADEFLEDGVGAAVMARQLLVLSTKAMAKDDEWQRRWPVNIDAWHALRQLAKRHKPGPLKAVKMRADDPDQPEEWGQGEEMLSRRGVLLFQLAAKPTDGAAACRWRRVGV